METQVKGPDPVQKLAATIFVNGRAAHSTVIRMKRSSWEGYRMKRSSWEGYK
jgi:hypothetical protein